LDLLERELEAILFAGGEPLEADRLAEALDVDERTLTHLIDSIRTRYREQNSPFEIAALSGAYQMCTQPQFGEVIRKALTIRRNIPLSPAALEVLAVIAYNQPVTRAFVEQVRGVDCSSIVRNLAEKGLVEEAGRLNIPGRPIAYRTTANFLRSFRLESLSQLPVLPQEAEEVHEAEDDNQLEGQMDLYM
jgi:segregation and condensation protein B